MRHRFFDLAFTPAVMAEQERFGSRAGYARYASAAAGDAAMTTQEIDFIAARDSFCLASIGETGWPYVQHRGGEKGFVRALNELSIGWAEYVGNRQYVSAGNVAGNDRVAMILLDYPNRRRLKLLGRMKFYDLGARPDLLEQLAGSSSNVERLVTVAVEGFDWYCPQHITPRYTLEEIDVAVAPLHARIAELEAALRT